MRGGNKRPTGLVFSDNGSENQDENHERWLVSYADFITLLFAFFVVLYATSSQNEEKEKKFEKSLQKELKLMALLRGGGKNEGKGSASTALGGGPFDGEGLSLIDSDTLDRSLLNNHDNPSEATSFERWEDWLEESIGASPSEEGPHSEEEGLDSPSDLRRPHIYRDDRGIHIALASAFFFPSGGATLKPEAIKALERVALILKKTHRNVIVEGHTDNEPLRTPPENFTNWELAGLRATQVVRYLIETQGLDPRRLAAISYADQRPLVPNNSKKNRARNRRIEILIARPDRI